MRLVTRSLKMLCIISTVGIIIGSLAVAKTLTNSHHAPQSIVSYATHKVGETTTPHAVIGPTRNPQLTWAPIKRKPLSDKAAAALVTREPEVRPNNVSANNYIPTNTDLQHFYNTRDQFHMIPAQQNHWYAYVTGRPGLVRNPTTDMLIQWSAHKWGIPEDTLKGARGLRSRVAYGLEWGSHEGACKLVQSVSVPSSCR